MGKIPGYPEWELNKEGENMVVAWTDITAGVTVKDVSPQLGMKIIAVRAPATFVNGTDTMAVNLSSYGASSVLGVIGFQETTAGSVTQQMAVHASTGGAVGLTTAVTGSGTIASPFVLTITPLLPATTCITTFIIFCY